MGFEINIVTFNHLYDSVKITTNSGKHFKDAFQHADQCTL